MERVKAKKKLLAAGKACLFRYTIITRTRVATVQGKRRTVAFKSAPKRKKPSKLVTKSRKKATAKPSVEELLQKVCREC